MDTKCEMCGEARAIYRCPACSKQTCSLSCVRQHKTSSGCDGVRDKTKFINIKKFTDIDLLSDYRFLEDAGRKADGAIRASQAVSRSANDNRHQRLSLYHRCKFLDIELFSMPSMMARRKRNDSHYITKDKVISWTTEWIFPQSDAKYTEQVLDTTLLSDVLSKFIHPTDSDPVVRQKLKVYIHPGIKNSKIFMKVQGRKADSVRYYELDKAKTLSEILSGKVIIEYPTFYCEPCYCCDEYTILDDGEANDSTEPFGGLIRATGKAKTKPFWLKRRLPSQKRKALHRGPTRAQKQNITTQDPGQNVTTQAPKQNITEQAPYQNFTPEAQRQKFTPQATRQNFTPLPRQKFTTQSPRQNLGQAQWAPHPHFSLRPPQRWPPHQPRPWGSFPPAPVPQHNWWGK